MTRLPITIALVLIASSVAFGAEEKRCSAARRDCEHQIRKHMSGRRYLGMTVERIPTIGLVIKAVLPDSPAKRAGFRESDRLIGINGRNLEKATIAEFKQTIADARETGKLWVVVLRRGSFRKIEVRLEPYTKQQLDKIIAAHMAQSHNATAAATP